MQSPRAYVACDPGSSRSGLAAVTPRGNVLYAAPLKAKSFGGMSQALDVGVQEMVKTLLGEGFCIDGFAVEDQTYRGRRDGKTKKSNPQHLISLAHVAGSAWASISRCVEAAGLLVPAETWKGSVPKSAHHRRLCSQLGWDYKEQLRVDGPRIVPIGIELLYNDLPSDVEWPDVLDAIGLARWLAKENQ